MECKWSLIDMWTTKKKIYALLYKLTSAWLPISQRSRLARNCRGFWAKRIMKHVGKNVNIERNATFGPNVSIDDNSGIGIDCEMYGTVTIGSNVMMGPEVVVYTSSHNYKRTDVPMNQQGLTEEKPVSIGNDVWIGRRAIIMPGVTIGNGCVIGAAALVTHDIPDMCVVGGVPATIIRKRG